MLARAAIGLILILQPVCASERDEWRAVYQNGEKVGFERLRFERDNDLWLTTHERRIKLRSRPVNTEQIIRSRDDGAIETYVLTKGREKTTTTFASPKGSARSATTDVGGREQMWMTRKDVRSPFWFQRQLTDHPMPERTRMRFTTTDGISETHQVTIESRDFTRVVLPNGKSKKLLALRVSFLGREVKKFRWYMNETGQVELAEFEYDGGELRSLLVPRSEAQTSEDKKRMSTALMQFVPADRALFDGREAEQAVFIVSGPSGLKELLQHEPRQLTRQMTEGAVEVTVAAQKLESAEVNLRGHKDYLAASKLIDHKERSVLQFANEAAAGEFDRAAIARKLQRAVGRLVRNRGFSVETLPASQILRTREGDCTEHAVLLTSLLRAKRIPARVATGLIYLDGQNGFSAHMWTEALINGKWIALDATFARKRGSLEPARTPGAGYLQVSHSSLTGEATAIDAFLPVADLMPQISIEIAPSK